MIRGKKKFQKIIKTEILLGVTRRGNRRRASAEPVSFRARDYHLAAIHASIYIRSRHFRASLTPSTPLTHAGQFDAVALKTNRVTEETIFFRDSYLTDAHYRCIILFLINVLIDPSALQRHVHPSKSTESHRIIKIPMKT